MFRCSGVQVFRCSGVQVFRCSGVQVFRCSGVQVFRCSGVQVFRCLGVLGFSTQHTTHNTHPTPEKAKIFKKNKKLDQVTIGLNSFFAAEVYSPEEHRHAKDNPEGNRAAAPDRSFIQNGMKLSFLSKTTFIQNHFHTTFIQNHFSLRPAVLHMKAR